MSKEILRIATRESPLAMWQAEYVQQALLDRYPDLQVELLPMTTKGDQILDAPLSKVGGKGLFYERAGSCHAGRQGRYRGSFHERCPDVFSRGFDAGRHL